MKRIAVVGGGASGLAAAVAASEHLRVMRMRSGNGAAGAHGGVRLADEERGETFAADGGSGEQTLEPCEVVVYEADERVGRSILATGNGRCNFSNAHLGDGDFRNADFVSDALCALQGRHMAYRGKRTMRVMEEDPVCEFFAERGLAWREEDDGRRYPATNKASTVLDVLRAAAAAGGAHEECGRGVAGIEAPRGEGGRFTLRMADGVLVRADAVVLACGGRAGMGAGVGGRSAGALAPAGPAGPAGFAFKASEVRPVLGPLKTETHAIKGLDGVRVRCAAELWRAGKRLVRERGEVLFRTYGVSGIAVFDLSRKARAGDTVVIDFLPSVRECDLQAFTNSRRKRMARHKMVATCEDFLRGLVLPSVGRAVCAYAGVAAGAPADKEELAQVTAALKHFPLKVQGAADVRQCQVARGGLAVEAFDPCTMEARELPGFFAAGEALDVDARCGGFNLHWAWASGILAGLAAAERVAEPARESEEAPGAC